MKRVFVITGLILVLLASYGFASGVGQNVKQDMGRDVMGDDPATKGREHMMEMMSRGPAVEHGKMMDGMKEMTLDMSGMLNDITGAIDDMKGVSRKISKDKRHRISDIMKDMSDELNMISEVMGEGEVSEEKLELMKSRIEDLQKQMGKLGK